MCCKSYINHLNRIWSVCLGIVCFVNDTVSEQVVTFISAQIVTLFQLAPV